MSARTVSLRALVIEDIARTAERAYRHAAAMLVRRFPDDDAALTAVSRDLAISVHPAARVAGAAAGALADGDIAAAVRELARFCGLDVAEWAAESAREQSVEVSL